MPVAHEIADARRIVLHGVTGSGKSTLAAALAGGLGCPWVDMDHLNWRPGWTELDPDVFRAQVAEVVAADAWVLDTAYSRVRDLVLARAQLVVALDLPRHVSFLRLLRRTTRRVVTGERVCHGNVETLRRTLGRNSILLWHHRSFARKRAAMQAMAAASDGPPVLVLRTPREVERLLATLAP